MQPHELMDMVQVKNRIVDNTVRIVHDRVQWEWQPGESKIMPKKLAEWFQAKSLYLFNPGDVAEGIPAKSHYKLSIHPQGAAVECDLTKAEVSAVKELLDTANMPELTRVDPTTGKPMRRVYIDPRSTGASDAKFRQRETALTKKVTSGIVKHAAEQIADAAQGASEEEIVAAVEDLTGVKSASV